MKYNKDIFVTKSIQKHGDIYDYSLVNYTDSKTKVKIICGIHGIFEKTPEFHLKHKGCQKCSFEKAHKSQSLSQDVFIKKCIDKHGDKYDYSLVEYVRAFGKVKIMCPIHGLFEQMAKSHSEGKGCLICSGKALRTTSEFINESNKVHYGEYDYSLVNYINAKTKVKIICKTHGVFEQVPSSHLQGHKCIQCKGKNRLTNVCFIDKSIKKHGGIYDYSLVNYVNHYKKVTIICPEHGLFDQPAGHHLNGTGCPSCKFSKGEKIIENYLSSKNIRFITQKRFNDCKFKKPLPFDFFIPDFNLVVEFHGLQHYQAVKRSRKWSDDYANEKFEERTRNDLIKIEFCKTNKINMLVIPYWEQKRIHEIINFQLSEF